MSRQITKSPPDGTAVALTELVRSRPAFLGWCKNGLTIDMGEATIYEDRAPNEAQKATLAARSEQLKAALEPSMDAKATRAVLLMLSSMPSAGGGEIDLEFRGEAFRIALRDLPAWAIEREAMRVIRGESKLGSRFAPTPPEFRETVSDSLASIRVELSQIEDIMRARVIPAPPEHPRLPSNAKRRDIIDGKGAPPLRTFSEALLKDLAERKERREAAESTTRAA